jgi:hypothetical protein
MKTLAFMLGACMVSHAGDLAQRSHQTELPGQQHNPVKTSMPGVGTWFWVARDFEPDGYKNTMKTPKPNPAFTLQ